MEELWMLVDVYKKAEHTCILELGLELCSPMASLLMAWPAEPMAGPCG